MKNFVKILRTIVIVFLLLIASALVIEYSRIRETEKTMIMLSRIAGNYALTASQDAGELTGDSRVNKLGNQVEMYKRTEYGMYLGQLNMASSAAESAGDPTLRFAYEILKADFDRAVTVSGGATYLDEYLQYTPIAFNLPYISAEMLEECYEDAMLQMVRDYKCKGTPSAFVAEDTSLGSFRTSHGTFDIVEINDHTPAYDAGTNIIGFNLVELTPELIRSIYGNEDYYSDTFEAIFRELDTDMYEELRLINFDAVSGSTTYIPQYNITFTTPYYYITSSFLLNFGGDGQLSDAVGFNGIASRLNAATDVAIYTQARVDNLSQDGNRYYDDAYVADGQLMFHLDNFMAQSTFQYTFLG